MEYDEIKDGLNRSTGKRTKADKQAAALTLKERFRRTMFFQEVEAPHEFA